MCETSVSHIEKGKGKRGGDGKGGSKKESFIVLGLSPPRRSFLGELADAGGGNIRGNSAPPFYGGVQNREEKKDDFIFGRILAA